MEFSPDTDRMNWTESQKRPLRLLKTRRAVYGLRQDDDSAVVSDARSEDGSSLVRGNVFPLVALLLPSRRPL